MNRRFKLVILCSLFLLARLTGSTPDSIPAATAGVSPAFTEREVTPATLDRWSHAALGRGSRSRSAVAALRAAGPTGLEALLRVHRSVLEAGPGQPRWRSLSTALDAVAGQKDAHAARLYWYTDLDRAQADARASGKPILSLRLLGRLDEEQSCANSRMFRSLLYADREVATLLRERFVLHWRSVRPVPKVRVDFGDGRVLERTVTGNSIHYILDPEGRLVTAIPGLWGPDAFRRELERGESTARRLAYIDLSYRPLELRAYHAARVREAEDAWISVVGSGASEPPIQIRNGRADIVPQPGPDSAPILPTLQPEPTIRLAPPTAEQAMPRAAVKSVIERPLLTALLPRLAPTPEDADAAFWSRIAEAEAPSIQLDAGAIALIAGQMARVERATSVENQARLARVVQRLVQGVAQDQARNRFQFQRRIHEWWAAGQVPDDLESLNEKVYAELFLTPSTDPWLGLAPEDVYTALPGEGLRTSNAQAAD